MCIRDSGVLERHGRVEAIPRKSLGKLVQLDLPMKIVALLSLACAVVAAATLAPSVIGSRPRPMNRQDPMSISIAHADGPFPLGAAPLRITLAPAMTSGA